MMFFFFCFFFFFKQKTAYEIVSGDWSSDVCSSDLRAGERDLRVVGEERGHEIGRRHDHALLCTDDRVVAILTVDGEAAAAALEPADRALVAEIPAPIPLQQVPADGAHRAQLHRRRVRQRLAQDRHGLRECIARLELDEGGERADAETPTFPVRPTPQALDVGEVDERGRTGETVLHEADEVRASGERNRAVAQHPERFGERARARIRERVQPRASAMASASSTRARVRGACRTRAPVAFATAFAIAAAVGMIGGSPSPLMPRLFALRSGRSTNLTVIFAGTSFTVGTL